MISWRFPGLLLLVCMALWSCSSPDQHAGGNWDETDNNMALRVLSAEGASVQGAQAKILPLSQWVSRVASGENPAVDSSLSDADGSLTLQCDSCSGQVSIEVQYQDSVARLLGDWDSLVLYGGTVTLAPPSQLVGEVSASVHGVWLAGTSIHAVPGQDHRFSLEGIAAGSHAIVLAVDDSLGVAGLDLVATFDVSQDSHLDFGVVPLAPTDRVLLDDFEDSSTQNRFGAMTGRGWWYQNADTGSHVEIDGSLAGTDCGAGRCLHATFTVPDSGSEYALVGVDLDAGPLGSDSVHSIHDLSDLDSLVFRARGQGSIRVQFILSRFAYPSEEYRFVFHTDIVLDSAWQEFRITPDDIIAAEVSDSLPSVREALQSVSAITWNAGESAELWLDDVVIYGIGQRSVFSSLSFY